MVKRAQLVQEKRSPKKVNNIVVTRLNEDTSPVCKKARKQLNETTLQVDTYSVSESKEIYLCINATNKEHSCNFGLCRHCYLKHEPTRGSRRRRNDEDDSSCNHRNYSSLHQFFDKQFFTIKYMEQVAKRKIAWTSHCNECGIKFVCTGRNGNIV